MIPKSIKSILLTLLLINNPLICMEGGMEEHQTEEQNTSPIESIPNELLLLIFQYKIHDIINAKNAAQAKEEFKAFLSAFRLTNKKFYQFHDELKEYFIKHKKFEVSDITFTRTELKFKVGTKEFVIEDEESVLNTFLAEITSVSNEALKKVGEDAVAEVEKIIDEGKRRQTYEALFSTIIWAPYDEAQIAKNNDAMDKIKVLVKPIFDAFPDKTKSTYVQKYAKYGF